MSNTSLMEVRSSRFGKGLFAINNIAANTILCSITGKPLTFEQTISMGDKESHSLQIDKDKYILCDAPFLYSNHACKPNCGINTHLQFVTLENIKKDEELFWDYSTSMLERHWTMQCLCGAVNCRKQIKDFDLLPDALQSKYLERNMVLPFIVSMLQSYTKEHVRRA